MDDKILEAALGVKPLEVSEAITELMTSIVNRSSNLDLALSQDKVLIVGSEASQIKREVIVLRKLLKTLLP